MAISRDRAQRCGLRRAGGVQVDAVEIVARLFGRDRKLGAIDHPLHVGSRQRERMRQVARGEIGEVAFRQGLQREARPAGADRQHRTVAVAFQHDLRTIRQLAYDVVEHMRGHGGRTRRRRLRGQRFRYLEIEVGGFQRQACTFGADQHIAQNRNGVAALDHAMHVTQRFQQLRAFDRDLHCKTRPIQNPTHVMEVPGDSNERRSD